ncbi:MAG: T9SS type A sorting domain-containing protein [Bacteroidales bacterium]|nr:T9SS type A sorting domain-containing protein [Bacteroidales bacterium]
MKHFILLFCILITTQVISQKTDPVINNGIGYYKYSNCIKDGYIKSSGVRDTIAPSFTISHTINGDVTINVISNEDLIAGWIDEKDVWSVANFDYWWLNTRLAKDNQNNIFAAVKLYEYSNPSGNFDMYKLRNNGSVLDEFNNWNGPASNPVIINNPSENIYIGQPTFDKEGAVDKNNLTYIFSGSGSIVFTKIDADGTVLINGQTIITGANSWTNEIRTAIDTNNKIYLVWSNDMHDITYAYSVDGGDTWSDKVSLYLNTSQQLNKPQICCDNNNNVHIIWQQWTGSSNILSYMKLLPDGTISIDKSSLTQSSNQVWSPQMNIDEENNIHIIWAKSSQQTTSAYYTKINGNLFGNGQSLSDDELTIIQEHSFLSNESIRYPKCIVDEYMNIHTVFERGEYGCNHPKSVKYKKMNSVPLLRIECPYDSLIFVEMTGSGTHWEGTFTPPENGTYNARVSGSDIDGNTSVDYYQFELVNVDIPDNELLSDNNLFLKNYPNPFSQSTVISYRLSISGKVILKVYDMFGQEIRTLVNENQPAGEYSVVWDGTDNSGNSVPNGIYFYGIKHGDKHTGLKKIILIK